MATGTLSRSERRWRRKAKVIKYRRPWVYEEQEEFLFTPARYSLVEATTKSGKTTGCLIWLNEKACLEGFEGWNGWWVAPVYGQAKIAYRRLKRFSKKAGALLKFNDGELSVLYPNGAKLWFKSAEKPDNLYGDDVYAAVFDEATRAREESWFALRSTLTYTRGPVRIIGNVKGRRNWAFKLARTAEAEMGANPRGTSTFYYAKLTAWHAVAAGILAREEVEDAQRVLPEAVFKELYLAEPTEDGQNPFGLAAIKKSIMPRLAVGPVAAWGVDLAKSIDFTVKCGLNRAGKMAAFDRYQRSWEATKADLRSTIGVTRALIDSTGVGDPIVEELQKGKDTITGYKFTSASKQMLMEGLAAAIARAADMDDPFIYAGPGNVVLNELEAFEYEYTKTGVRYNAPKGFHDDTVCALALAVEQHRQLGRAGSRGGKLLTL
jgi:hypothetical protein